KVREEAVGVGQKRDGLPHVLRGGHAIFAGQADESIARAQVVCGVDGGILRAGQRQPGGNDLARGDLVDHVHLAAFKLLQQRIVEYLFKDDPVYGGQAAFEVAQVVGVDFENGAMRLGVVGNEAVRAGGDARIVEVTAPVAKD